MDLWIPVTLAAATAQTVRFVLQKHLRGTGLSTAGTTFARFVYSAPLATVLALGYARISGQALPPLPGLFWANALTGGLAQILATMCVVVLFAQRAFAVGATFAKTEVLLSVPLGLILLGDRVGGRGLAAILVGLAGVVLLSDPPGGTGRWHRRLWNRAAGLGLASGLLFAISGVGYRGASLALGSGDPLLRALVTLACVTGAQLIAMAAWLVWRERGEIVRVLRAWRVAGLVGITSLIGSACWFLAFTLQTVAYVKALGQVELILSLAASVLIFGERLSRREGAGVALLGLGAVALVLWA